MGDVWSKMTAWCVTAENQWVRNVCQPLYFPLLPAAVIQRPVLSPLNMWRQRNISTNYIHDIFYSCGAHLSAGVRERSVVYPWSIMLMWHLFRAIFLNWSWKEGQDGILISANELIGRGVKILMVSDLIIVSQKNQSHQTKADNHHQEQ